MEPALARLWRCGCDSGAAKRSGPPRSRATCPRRAPRLDRIQPRYQRALDMLRGTLPERPFLSEVPFPAPERVSPAAPSPTSRGRPSPWSRWAPWCTKATLTSRLRPIPRAITALGEGAGTPDPAAWESITRRIRPHRQQESELGPAALLPARSRGRGASGACMSGCTPCPAYYDTGGRGAHLGRGIAEDLLEARVAASSSRHLRDLQSLRRSDSQGDRTAGLPVAMIACHL